MAHEGGGAKPSKKSKVSHFAMAEKRLEEAMNIVGEIAWNDYGDDEMSRHAEAEMLLKAAHVHAMLAVAVASGQSGLTQTIIGGPPPGYASPAPHPYGI